MGTQGIWYPKNTSQTMLIQQYWPKKAELQKLLPEELKSCASKDVSVVNRFLKDNDFTIQLKDLQRKDSFSVASILNIMLEWVQKGTKDVIVYKEVCYPAVKMEDNYAIKKTKNGTLIASVKANNGDIVYMSLAQKPLQGFELLNHVTFLSKEEAEDVSYTFKELIFPMVDINQHVDISWLITLAHSTGYEVVQALQETRFQMNEKGAAVQSAVTIMMIECAVLARKSFKLDAPFYLWIERSNMTIPLFAAYVDTTDWKEPLKLGRQ